MLLTFPGTQKSRRHLLLRQSMQAWHDCLPMQQADWIGSECGRVFLRGMALDWLAENGRGGREWLCAAGMGLDAWHQAAAHAEAMITLPRGQWKMGVAQGLPVIRPTMGAGEQEEEADEPVARLGMRQWEDVISRITEEEIDDLVRQAVRVTRQDIAERVDERDRHLDIPLAMSVASVALMGLAILRVVGIEQLAIAGGSRAAPWYGYLGRAAA